jgi:hypothetical protein
VVTKWLSSIQAQPDSGFSGWASVVDKSKQLIQKKIFQLVITRKMNIKNQE